MSEVKEAKGNTIVSKCGTCASATTRGCLFQNEVHGAGNRVFNKTTKQPKTTGHSVFRCTACGELKEV